MTKLVSWIKNGMPGSFKQLLVIYLLLVSSASAMEQEMAYCPSDGLRFSAKPPPGFIPSDSTGPCLVCSTDALTYEKIKSACMISKSKGAQPQVLGSIRKSCSMFACDPSWLQKLRYR